ncbi:MAG: GNAT family N-acetyltransferase [Brevibacterium aurantiacum]|uniref:GNAT family N-acetyltransferase n=1 Tax=Brevibacterium aurantiacum TaxID=273384 RepID=UPI003F9309F0
MAEPFVLDRPGLEDLDEIFEIYGDPRVWTHFPSGRMIKREEAEAYLLTRIADWEIDGLRSWIVRESEGGPVLGMCGCGVRRMPLVDEWNPERIEAYWNLGYRFRPEVQGRGYASEISRLAIARAQEVKPELPVIAYLLEHNEASRKVAEKVGLSLQYRAPDAGNPDPQAMRLVFADRTLTGTQLAAALI